MGNMHIVSGSVKTATENHRIPGKNDVARAEVKAMCMRRALESLMAGADLAASQGEKTPLVLLVGDFNMLPAAMEDALDKSCPALRALFSMHGALHKTTRYPQL